MDFIKNHIIDFKELKNLKTEHEKLLTSYKNLQSKLKNERENHEKEIAEIKIHETEYLECIKEKDKIIASQEQYISKLKENYEKIKGKLDEKQKEIDVLRQLGKTFDKERKQSEKLKNDYDILKDELRGKNKEVRNLKSSLDRKESDYKQKLEQLENWLKEKSDIEYLLIKAEEKNALLEEENKKNVLLLEQYKEKICELKSKISLQKNILNEENIRTGKNFILCAGSYKGGVDIPIGRYNIRAVKGTGILETNKPKHIRLVMTSVEELIKHENIEEYHGLEISKKTILTITRTVNIEFSL